LEIQKKELKGKITQKKLKKSIRIIKFRFTVKKTFRRKNHYSKNFLWNQNTYTNNSNYQRIKKNIIQTKFEKHFILNKKKKSWIFLQVENIIVSMNKSKQVKISTRNGKNEDKFD